MPRLRQLLQSGAPELFAALTRSWEIAQKDWLPAISPSEGSYNSQPHFANVERHLEELLASSSESAAVTLRLSNLEVYLLLASVLFHDYGRVHGNVDHAKGSAQALMEQFAAFGIPSAGLAASLARIALYHDPLSAADKRIPAAARQTKIIRIRQTLRTVRIEPYGPARELYVAVLLALADHMDGSILRAVPPHIISNDVVGIKGAFRRLVSGTSYDSATCTLKTCLNGFDRASDENPGAFDYRHLYRHFLRWQSSSKNSANQPPAKTAIPPAASGASKRNCPLFRDLVSNCCDFSPGSDYFTPSKMFYLCLAGQGGHQARYMIERKILRDKVTNEKRPTPTIWPADYLLAIVLNDIRTNRGFLKNIKEDLYEMGLPIDDWLVEFNSEVYDADGNRVSEPMLPVGLLQRVAAAMWELRLRLFGSGILSYEVLADSLRMENVALVRLAVQRIVGRVPADEFGRKLVAAGASGWCWNVPADGLDQDAGLDQILKAVAPSPAAQP